MKLKLLLGSLLLSASMISSAQQFITLGPGQTQVPLITPAEFHKLWTAERADHQFFASGAAGHMGEGSISVMGQVAILITIGGILYAMWEAENNPPELKPRLVYTYEIPCYSQNKVEVITPTGRRYMQSVCK